MLPYSFTRLAAVVVMSFVAISAYSQIADEQLPRKQDTSSRVEQFLPNKEVGVTIVNAVGMPVTLSSADVQTDFGRGLSRLSYLLSTAEKELKTVSIYVIIRSADGEIRGGEAWTSGAECEHRPLQIADKRSQILRHELVPGDTLLLTVRETVTEKGRYRFDWKGGLEQQFNPVVVQTAAVSPNYLCGDDYCDWCVLQTTGVCGRRGVKSFSCSVGTCTCGFTCGQ